METLTSVVAFKRVIFFVPESESLKEEQGSRQSTSSSRDVLRLLAEVCFINAEVCGLPLFCDIWLPFAVNTSSQAIKSNDAWKKNTI